MQVACRVSLQDICKELLRLRAATALVFSSISAYATITHRICMNKEEKGSL